MTATRDDQQSAQDWQEALRTALVDAIEHLQMLIFDQEWDRLRVEIGSDEAALRESVVLYERELARLFGFLRASGALPDGVAWSTLKTELRRAALDAGTEISLRTALESGFYVAEPIPLGDHAAYLRWSVALRGFLASRVTSPPPAGSDDERLQWAYETLAAIEDHDAFDAAFITWLNATGADRAIVEHQRRLLALPRYDLVLNASLRWLATTTRP